MRLTMRLTMRPASVVWSLGTFLILFLVPVKAEVALGPFNAPQDLAQAKSTLELHGFAFAQRLDEERESLGYIVVSERTGPGSATGLVRQLSAAGVSDIVYITTGVYAGRVSAGVFSSSTGAASRARDLQALGFSFEIMERSRLVRYSGWLDIDAGDLDSALVRQIEGSIGYALSAIPDAPVQPAESTPPDERGKPVPSPAALPETNATPVFSQAPVVTTTPPQTVPVDNLPGTPVVTVSTPLEPTNRSLPFVFVFVIAIVIGALAAYVYLRFATRSHSKNSGGVYIGYQASADSSATGDTNHGASFAHDAPTPLERMADAILGGEGEGTTALLASVESTSPNAIELIDDMLHLARVESGAIGLDKVAFDLSSFMNDIVDTARSTTSMTIKFRETSPLPVVRTDAGKLHRIFRNLVARMREFDDSAPIAVSAGLSHDDVPEFELRIDNDFSIFDQAAADELFDTTTINGMRMTISRRLARVLGGDIKVGAREQSGTCIRLAVPVALAEDGLLLSSGISVAELREAQASARVEIESAHASLVEMRALTEHQQKTLAQTEQLANETIEAQRQAEESARQSIEDLTAQLSEARRSTRAQLEDQTRAIADSEARVNVLQAELDAARKSAAEIEQQRAALETNGQGQINELKQRLDEAEVHLQAELAAREQTTAEANGYVARLNKEFEELRDHMTQESERYASQQARSREEIDRLKHDLEESRAQLAELDSRESERIAELEERNRTLMLSISDAEQRQQDDHLSRTTADGEVGKRLEELEQALEQARADVARETHARQEAQAVGKRRQAELMTDLKRTRRELEDTLNRNADLPDIEVLQNALTQAEDELGQEKAERVRVEKETAAYINELMDDLNKARSEARKEAAARTDAELTVEQRLSALSAELEDTRRRLIAEASARQRAEEKAKAAVSSGQQTKPDIEPEAAQTSAEIQEDHTGTPIKSSMPMNNPILHSMAERFVLRLDEQLDALEAALDDGMPHEMMLITNWLKGEAYTLGFHDFTRPVSDLEALLKDQEYTRIPAKIVELKHMAARIELEGASIAHPAGAEAGRSDRSRLRYTLPTNARKAEMMENFIGQLGTQLLEFEAAAASGNTSELTKIIRWILKYASAFELNEITDATQALQSSVENSVESTERGAAPGDVADKLNQLSGLYSTIEIVKRQ